MRRSGWKTTDPLLDSLPRYDKVKIQDLVVRLMAGEDTKEDLILQLLAVCRIILCRQLYHHPTMRHHVPDLVGVLMLRTCNIVELIIDGKLNVIVETFFAYYIQSIRNELKNFNSGDSNPNVSAIWFRRQRQNGNAVPVRLPLNENLLQNNPTDVLELEDILLTLAETEFERDVIILRYQNYTESEIADMFNVARQWVNQVRTTLELRYNIYLQQLETK